MENEKLLCIRHKQTREVKRLPESLARAFVSPEDSGWVFVSKGVYKKYIKDLAPKYSGQGTSSSGHSKGMKIRPSNNRKSTKGRNTKHVVFTTVRKTKVDRGYLSHTAKCYTRTDPVTGTILTVKSGKGNNGKQKGEGIFHTTLNKGSKLVSTTSIKFKHERVPE